MGLLKDSPASERKTVKISVAAQKQLGGRVPNL